MWLVYYRRINGDTDGERVAIFDCAESELPLFTAAYCPEGFEHLETAVLTMKTGTGGLMPTNTHLIAQ